MQTAERRLDYDPPPRDSPRLYGEMGGLECSTAFAEKPRRKPSGAERRLLERDLALYLAVKGGMSIRAAARTQGRSFSAAYEGYKRMKRREMRRERV